MNIGWSKFAKERHVEGSGNSFFVFPEKTHGLLPHDLVIDRCHAAWSRRYPGQGETGLDRKVVVPIAAQGFFLSTTALRDNLPLRAEVTRRQPEEDPHIEIYVDADEAKALGIEYEPAQFVNIVVYSAEALLENGGERSTESDWEIVAVLASKTEKESMMPLVMARNFLEMPGGTKSIYTAQEFAEAIYYHSTHRGIKIKKSSAKQHPSSDATIWLHRSKDNQIFSRTVCHQYILLL
jgi:hypothetical protein